MAERAPKPQRRGPRITKVYTRIGDEGMTGLVGGQKVPKDAPRIHAYGTSDELQVTIGAARDALDAANLHAGHAGVDAQFKLIDQHLVFIQNLLFSLGGELATRPEDQWDGMPRVGGEDIEYMEKLIDALNAPLPPLADFVLPGGHPAVTALHTCRVVCRRAERQLETLARAEPVGPYVRPFLNRLSDLFFVLSRRVAHELNKAGVEVREEIWRRDLERPPLPE